MAQITAALVKELRDKTSAGMMDCKKALNETGGDLEAAVDWLRTKGIAKADKKASRIAAEGLVAVALAPNSGALVEINSETDFVARNDGFQALVGKIGENMNFRRMAKLTVSDGVVAGYIHNSVASGMGKIGVLVALESSGDKAKLEDLAKKIAMHVAATSPPIVDKMVEGRMTKFFKESVLMTQVFVMDGERAISKVIEDEAAALGTDVKMTGYVRMGLGEGIEKKEEDFAAEVAATLKDSEE